MVRMGRKFFKSLGRFDFVKRSFRRIDRQFSSLLNSNTILSELGSFFFGRNVSTLGIPSGEYIDTFFLISHVHLYLYNSQ